MKMSKSTTSMNFLLYENYLFTGICSAKQSASTSEETDWPQGMGMIKTDAESDKQPAVSAVKHTKAETASPPLKTEGNARYPRDRYRQRHRCQEVGKMTDPSADRPNGLWMQTRRVELSAWHDEGYRGLIGTIRGNERCLR